MRTPIVSLSFSKLLLIGLAIVYGGQISYGQSVSEVWDSIKGKIRGEVEALPLTQTATSILSDSTPIIDPSQGGASLVQKYALIHRLINRGSNIEGDSATADGANADFSVYRLASQKEVFGWHPYWMGDAAQNYQYNLLSTLSFFSYDINPLNGTYKNRDAIDGESGWRYSTVIDDAKAVGCKVLLAITCFGEEETRKFLSDPFAQSRLIDSLKVLLAERQADGVDVDFEGLPADPAIRDRFSSFIRVLSEQIRGENPGYMINIDLHSQYDERIYNIAALDKYANSFVMMGYDYAGSTSSPEPIAPLFWERRDSISPTQKEAIRNAIRNGRLDISQSINEYKEAKIPPYKLILGLPYYGGDWAIQLDTTREDNKIRIDTNYIFSHLSYRQIMARVDQVGGYEFDKISLSNTFRYIDMKKQEHIVWFDDPNSLDIKFDWAIQQNLKGVGLWALGYDDGFPDMWQTVANRFTLDTFGDSRPAVSFTSFIWQYRHPIIVNLLFLLMFMAAGFIWSLFNWKVSEKLFFSRTFRTVYITLFFILAILAISLFDLQWKRNGIFALGLVIGTAMAWIINRITESRRNQIPK